MTLTAGDGFELGAYRSEPADKPKGGLVVVQEIFGVNHHIRAVCDRFAGHGYLAIAPAVFDRIERNFECGYSPDEIAHARTLIPKIDWKAMLRDVAAARDALNAVGKIGIVGFCMGGSVAFLAAAKLSGFAAAIGYYGGQIAKNADEKPKVPTLLHFGDQDQSIPMADVELIRQKRPDCTIHIYHAGHGFSCDERSAYDAASAKLAMERTLAWLGRHVG